MSPAAQTGHRSKLQPDMLNGWLNEHHFSVPPVRYDLAASTGPVWTLRALLAFEEDWEPLLDSSLSYVHSSGGQELREAIGEMSGVPPTDVQVTTGGAEALWIIFMLAAEPDANVVLPQRPSFPTFHAAPPFLGMEVREYRMPRTESFGADLDDVRRLVDGKTKVIVVNRPHNPTGAVMPEEQLEALHELAFDRGIQLVVDEVMHPIYHDPSAPASASRLPGVTVVGDFSKALCLSGLRLGWMVEHDPARRAAYENARSFFTVSSSSLSERLAVTAVRNRREIYDRAQRIAQRNLALLDRFFDAHDDRFAWVRPGGGMTALPWLRSGESARDLCEAAVAAGVLLAPGDCFGVPEHFRVGFGATDDGFADAVERLDAVVTSQG